jgi:hypothetical protein
VGATSSAGVVRRSSLILMRAGQLGSEALCGALQE